MGPARTVTRRIVENQLSRSPLGACARAPQAEFYAKLSKLPKLYMVTPLDRQGNGRALAWEIQEEARIRRLRTLAQKQKSQAEPDLRGGRYRDTVLAASELQHKRRVGRGPGIFTQRQLAQSAVFALSF